MSILRDNVFTGSPMSRLEFATRLLAEGAAGQTGGVYNAGTLMLVSALFSSMPPETLIRMGDATTTSDMRLFRMLKRRQEGRITAEDRLRPIGPWPLCESGIRDFLSREIVNYVEVIRKSLMKERVDSGLPNHEYMYVVPASDSAEIAAPYSLEGLEREFRRAFSLMAEWHPDSAEHYRSELDDVRKLPAFLKWKVTSKGRSVVDPLSDVQATLLFLTNSPIRIESGDAWRYLNKITDEHIAASVRPGPQS